MIRLAGSEQLDRVNTGVPRFAPFVAAGFYFASAAFLRDVPFDPLLPCVFVGVRGCLRVFVGERVFKRASC